MSPAPQQPALRVDCRHGRHPPSHSPSPPRANRAKAPRCHLDKFLKTGNKAGSHHGWRVGGVVTQRIANPCTPVRFRYSPPNKINDLDEILRYTHRTSKHLSKHSAFVLLSVRHPGSPLRSPKGLERLPEIDEVPIHHKSRKAPLGATPAQVVLGNLRLLARTILFRPLLPRLPAQPSIMAHDATKPPKPSRSWRRFLICLTP